MYKQLLILSPNASHFLFISFFPFHFLFFVFCPLKKKLNERNDAKGKGAIISSRKRRRREQRTWTLKTVCSVPSGRRENLLNLTTKLTNYLHNIVTKVATRLFLSPGWTISMQSVLQLFIYLEKTIKIIEKTRTDGFLFFKKNKINYERHTCYTFELHLHHRLRLPTPRS